MTRDPEGENPRLLRQHVEKNRKGDRDLAQKPGQPPRPDDEQTTSDDDQRQTVRQRQPRTDRSGRRSAG